MGMFTDLFKKSHDPYDLGGRWYKMRIQNESENITVISSDIPKVPAGVTPDEFGYMLNDGPEYTTLNIAFGTLTDFTVVPVDGNVEYNSFEQRFTSSQFAISFISFNPQNVTGTFDLYLYVVR